LGKLNRLDLLSEVYPNVSIPDAVFHEVVSQGAARGEPDAMSVRLFLHRHQWQVVAVPEVLLANTGASGQLGDGERAVLALAQHVAGALVLLDDAVARKEARRLGIKAQGTVGILAEAYRQHWLTRIQLAHLFEEIVARPDIWISEQLCREVLAQLPE
jgi:predicted nucleic acid-binding protein